MDHFVHIDTILFVCTIIFDINSRFHQSFKQFRHSDLSSFMVNFICIPNSLLCLNNFKKAHKEKSCQKPHKYSLETLFISVYEDHKTYGLQCLIHFKMYKWKRNWDQIWLSLLSDILFTTVLIMHILRSNNKDLQSWID